MKITESDLISILEIARVAMSHVPEDVADHLDISDNEFVRLRELIHNQLESFVPGCVDGRVLNVDPWDKYQESANDYWADSQESSHPLE